ncbi:Oidioi.mRNA.OKI2018_I69.chr2.g5372.t1.cds [Oikopleura dioica]|uniref:Oidioi.mRNA.OKI2018_I69.chr2.g5372.t1.cds n=1 Tax=Oikopleura dioica TaxID=34765 RepID=A0ABN7T092_OIKDI|nr:Oidioi.mRNA.OKI2018_I69.chr2.g5372.t1.cds [Oikopleura dioica]
MDGAKIFSPEVQITDKTYCIELFYLAYGKALFRRSLGLKNLNKNEEIIISNLPKKSVNNEHWIEVRLETELPETWRWGKMQLFLTVTRGFSFASEVAFDDISLKPGKCPKNEKKEQPPPTARTYLSPTPTNQPAKIEVVREYNPFFTLNTRKCSISSWDGKKMIRTEETYSVQFHLCCGNKLVSRSAGDKCCEGAPYYSRKQVCCGGKVFEKQNGYSCCSEKYVNDGRVCCGGSELKEPAKEGCCSGSSFSRDEAFCIENRVVQKAEVDENRLCGNNDFKIQLAPDEACCNGNAYKSLLFGCCSGGFVYDLRYEECNEWGKPKKLNFYKSLQPKMQLGMYFFSYTPQ